LSANTQVIALSGANTFAGGVTLNSGSLSLNSSAALGTGALTVNGGTLRFGGSFSLGNAITLQSDLVVTSAGQIAGAITSATPGTGLTLRSESGILNLAVSSTYSGPTTIDFASILPRPPVPGRCAFQRMQRCPILQRSTFELAGRCKSTV
jgi:autotransporter-associated beta strand protein